MILILHTNYKRFVKTSLIYPFVYLIAGLSLNHTLADYNQYWSPFNTVHAGHAGHNMLASHSSHTGHIICSFPCFTDISSVKQGKLKLL